MEYEIPDAASAKGWRKRRGHSPTRAAEPTNLGKMEPWNGTSMLGTTPCQLSLELQMFLERHATFAYTLLQCDD